MAVRCGRGGRSFVVSAAAESSLGREGQHLKGGGRRIPSGDDRPASLRRVLTSYYKVITWLLVYSSGTVTSILLGLVPVG